MSYSLKDLTVVLEDAKITFEVLGDLSVLIDSPAEASISQKGHLAWLKKSKQELLPRTKASVVITDIHKAELKEGNDRCYLLTNNPRAAFAAILRAYFLPSLPQGIHSSAIIDETAELSSGVAIGPNAVIGKCRIGKNSIIEANCVLHDSVEIGKHTIIHSGVSIGTPGFGYEKDSEGWWQQFPQIGGVKIGDYVEIGANTCIDRGALCDTIIEDNVKIDNLVHIAHNVRIGSNSLIAASAHIAGSVEIGKNVWIAPSSQVRNGIKVGDGAFIGIGSAVIQDVPTEGKVFGNPARKTK